MGGSIRQIWHRIKPHSDAIFADVLFIPEHGHLEFTEEILGVKISHVGHRVIDIAQDERQKAILRFSNEPQAGAGSDQSLTFYEPRRFDQERLFKLPGFVSIERDPLACDSILFKKWLARSFDIFFPVNTRL